MNSMMGPISGRGLRDLSGRSVENPKADQGRGARILFVDDDAAIRQMVESYLEEHDMHVVTASQRSDMARQFAAAEPSLVILDLRLGQEDGLDLLREIRANSDVPVIITTGHRRDEIDRVVGLELGADDYVAKPCELRELMARIRSVLRRSAPVKPAQPAAEAAGAAKAAKDQLVRFGTKWLDLEAQALRDDEGNEHPLTASEFSLLKVFAANPKRVLSRERLLELANARDAEAFDRAVDLRIMRIRRKIEPDPTKPAVIRTIRGGGYLFSPAGDKA
jgi:two-component system, OmpR family, response regulator